MAPTQSSPSAPSRKYTHVGTSSGRGGGGRGGGRGGCGGGAGGGGGGGGCGGGGSGTERHRSGAPYTVHHALEFAKPAPEPSRPVRKHLSK